MQIIARGLIHDGGAAPEGERFACFVGLAQLADGTLLCSFKTGPQKLSAKDNLRVMRSADGGATWTPLAGGFETTIRGVAGSITAGYITEVAPGRLLMSAHWVDRSDPALPLAHPATTGLLPFKCLQAASADAGATWSAWREVSLWPHRGASPTGEILRLADGQLALPYESWKDWNDTDGIQAANLRLSRDGGETWSQPVTMACDPYQDRYLWDNRIAVHPADGRLLALFWTYARREKRDDEIHLAWGSPDACEWSRPRPTGIRGQIACPVFMGNHKILVVYVHRQNPPGLRAVLSRDFGKTWDQPSEVVLYDSVAGQEAGMGQARDEADYWHDMYRWTFGHPKALRLADGTVLVAFYGGSPKQLSIHCVRLTPPDDRPKAE